VVLAHLLTAGSYLVTGLSWRGARGLLRGSLSAWASRRDGVHFLAALLVALAEEALLRGLALCWLTRWTGSAATALVLASLLFALGHLRPPWRPTRLLLLLDYFLLGLVLGGLVLATGALLPAVVLHAVRNYVLRCVLVSKQEYLAATRAGDGTP